MIKKLKRKKQTKKANVMTELELSRKVYPLRSQAQSVACSRPINDSVRNERVFIPRASTQYPVDGVYQDFLKSVNLFDAPEILGQIGKKVSFAFL